MIKKEIEFESLTGEKVKREFYFHLSKAELTEWRMELDEGLEARLQDIKSSTKVDAKVIKAFKDIISRSVGVCSEDGIRFIKTEEITNEFMQSEAYSSLFMELVTDTAKAAEFINNVVSREMAEKAATAMAEVTKSFELPQLPQEASAQVGEVVRTAAVSATPSQPNFLAMSPQDFATWQQRQSSPLGA